MPLSTGEIISETVENLLADSIAETRRSRRDGRPLLNVRRLYTEKLNELADFLGVKRTYMPRKMQDGIWSAKDLDHLAVHFGKLPGEFLPASSDDNWGVDIKPPHASTDETEGPDPTASAPKDPNMD